MKLGIVGIFFSIQIYAGKTILPREAPCTEFRLDQPGNSMAEVSVLNQNNTGTCYAHSASSMLSALGNTRGIKINAEPMALAIQSKDYEVGSACRAVNSALKDGFCEGENLSEVQKKEMVKLHKAYQKSIEGLSIKRNDSFFTQLKRDLYDAEFSKGISLERELKYRREERQKTALQIFSFLNPDCNDPTPEQTQLHAIFVALEKADAAEFLAALKDICKDKKTVPNSSHYKCNNSFTGLGTRIEHHFAAVTSQTLPVEISYGGYVLTEGDKSPRVGIGTFAALIFKKDFFDDLINVSEEHSSLNKFVEQYGPHSSVLIGRRKNVKTGQCEYLIQNSWGESCEQYNPAFECEKGKIWVPKIDLFPRMIGIGIIEKI